MDKKKVVGTITIKKSVTVDDVENIMITAIEGGIGYWACLLNDRPEWNDQCKGESTSEFAANLLLKGKSVWFQDAEEDDEAPWELTLTKLLNGLAQNAKERPHDCDLEQGDATTADCIVQYALFSKVVYG